ncbi:hypothetical protein Tco_0940772 [Tanacetum coccineum]|uniref:Uncharacterized protein n=1 Tax=Tanacetum coccineum TaxID=301880 RepID=A0ABQ5DR73_9ASTR
MQLIFLFPKRDLRQIFHLHKLSVTHITLESLGLGVVPVYFVFKIKFDLVGCPSSWVLASQCKMAIKKSLSDVSADTSTLEHLWASGYGQEDTDDTGIVLSSTQSQHRESKCAFQFSAEVVITGAAVHSKSRGMLQLQHLNTSPISFRRAP